MSMFTAGTACVVACIYVCVFQAARHAVERAGGSVAVDEARLLAVLHRGEPRRRAALSVALGALVEVEEDVPLLLELRELDEDLQR